MRTKTPYERHQDLSGHPTTRAAVNTSALLGSADIEETCSTCGQRWLHTRDSGTDPLTMPPVVPTTTTTTTLGDE